MHFSPTGSGRYKRHMVLPVLRECIDSIQKMWLMLDFNLFYQTIWTYLMDLDLLPSLTTLSDYSYLKNETSK